MPNRRSFKTDESFLEKLAIGAIGARAVFDDLQRGGHRPIELERGSTSYKIWKQIKIKRVRVPDILCLTCTARFEARAKTQLEISMSHSLSSSERGWDSGLADRDMVAFSLCTKIGDRPIDWQASELVQFVSVRDLRRAFAEGRVIQTKPKGAQEGFELRVTWPCAKASSDGVVTEVSQSRIQFRRTADSRMITLGLAKASVTLEPLVGVSQGVRAGQIIASVVPVLTSVDCPAAEALSTFLQMLSSPAVADRYTGAKALSHLQTTEASQALIGRVRDDQEHIYVRLEAAAGLARDGQPLGMDFISRTLRDDYLEHRLEAVIILGEIRSTVSSQMLTSVLLDGSQHPEIRAGAAWALGELGQASSIDSLIQAFLELAEAIRIEAARALHKIAATHSADIIARLPHADDTQRAGIAWAVSRSRRVRVEQLLPLMVDDDARRWVAYILGMQDQQEFVVPVEELRRHDPEVYFAVTVLWKILASWVYHLEEY